ncbi:ALP1-like protein [Tanacetum coccineum]
MFTEACQAAYEASKSKLYRTPVERDHYGAHDRLVIAYFSVTPTVIMNLYGEEFLRKLTYTNMEKLYAHHDEKHEFPGMLGSIDCIDWSWANCPVTYRAQFSRGDHGADPFILLEKRSAPKIYGFACVLRCSGMNNNVELLLRQSPILPMISKSGSIDCSING